MLCCESLGVSFYDSDKHPHYYKVLVSFLLFNDYRFEYIVFSIYNN